MNDTEIWESALIKVGYTRDHEAAFAAIGEPAATLKMLQWLLKRTALLLEHYQNEYLVYLWRQEKYPIQRTHSLPLALAAAVNGVKV